MTSCPHCFTPLSPDERLYRCPGPCESFTDPVASAFRGSQVIAFTTQGLKRDGKTPWNPPPSIPCYRCSKPTAEICPTRHLDLPAGWRGGNAVCVALAGARATGKSIYLAVLIKQLEQMLHQMNSLLSFATTASYSVYTSAYEAQLYREREIMQATAPANMANAYQTTPLIVSLGLVNGVPQHLVLRDVAGEDLERPGADQTYLSYFRLGPRGLLLVRPIRGAQCPRTVAWHRSRAADAARGSPRVLHNLLAIIGDASPPIAMILSKFDTLQEFATTKTALGARSCPMPGPRSNAIRKSCARATTPPTATC